MIERVRITAETTTINYAARFGYPGRTLADYLDQLCGWDGYIDDPFGTRPRISLRAFDGADPGLFLKLMFAVPQIPGDDFPQGMTVQDGELLTIATPPRGVNYGESQGLTVLQTLGDGPQPDRG